MIEQPQLLLSEENRDDIDVSETELIFLLQSADNYTLQYPFKHNGFWEFFSHRISRTPDKLIFHVQRIYYCFKENRPDQLYASVVDLLIALHGNRDGLAQRMFNGSKPILKKRQRKILGLFFQHPTINEHQLPINNYSVLGKGGIGVDQLVIAGNDQADTVAHDPLMLARDFIEFSQLNEAREVLEAAIVDQPENRELHEELLGLYKSTRDQINFQKMYVSLKELNCSLLQLWEPLKPLLGGKPNEE